MHRRVRPAVHLGVSSLVVLLASVALAVDPPDSAVNPVSGYVETTDATLSSGNYEVRHTVNPGQGQDPQVTTLTSASADDLDPRLVISTAGDTWVVWWRDEASRKVLVRKRTYSTGAWDAERQVGNSSESGRRPRIVHDGTNPWVAYENTAGGGGTKIIVQKITDGSDPIPTGTVLSTTTYGGDLAVVIRSESSHLWVAWVDSSTHVGWSQYTYATQTWTAAAYESYASDSVAAARARIRTTVLGS